MQSWAPPMPYCRCICFAESLLAGLPQRVKFTILTGHYEVKKGDALQLSNTDSMPILHSSSCSARILSGTGGERSKRSHDVRFDLLCMFFCLWCLLYAFSILLSSIFFLFYIFCRAGERGWSVHPGFREGDKHLSASNSTLPHTGVPARGAVPYPIITSTCRKWAPHQRRDPSPAEEPHTLQQRHGFHRPEGLGDSKANMIRIAINDTMGIYFYLLHFRFWAEWSSHLIGYNVIFWFVFVFSGVHRLSLVYIFHPHFPHLLYPLQSQTCATVSREKVCKIVCTFSLCLLVTLE